MKGEFKLNDKNLKFLDWVAAKVKFSAYTLERSYMIQPTLVSCWTLPWLQSPQSFCILEQWWFCWSGSQLWSLPHGPRVSRTHTILRFTFEFCTHFMTSMCLRSILSIIPEIHAAFKRHNELDLMSAVGRRFILYPGNLKKYFRSENISLLTQVSFKTNDLE